jgi:TRAP-type mannitol/chloroaromatic compound transport system permease small subunit
MSIVCYDVIARYFFNKPTEWAMEINTHILCIYTLLCGGFVLLKGGHVSVDILYGRFNLRTKSILACGTSFFFFIFALVILWFGWEMAWSSFEQRETSGALMDWPLYPTKFVVPLAALLLLLQGIVKFINDLSTAVTGKLPEGVPEVEEGIFARPRED